MKISNNPVKYEVLIKQYFRSILDISVEKHRPHKARVRKGKFALTDFFTTKGIL